jgi:glycosyltransferase involved in cell wall biosynthesis
MPRFSIITPVYNPPRDAFELCVKSVLEQSNPDWEWCLANDASPDDWVAPRLQELQLSEPRIRVVDRAMNGGIVAASNDAIALARGEFLVLLDNDDELHKETLQMVAEALNEAPECDYLYSDENKISPDGVHFDDFAKPRWSPERLLAQNYTSHLSVLRRSLVEQVGRFRSGFDGSQDYDLILRVIEQARKVVHVPQVLYHWRTLPTSTASAASAKPYAFVAALKAVGEHLERTHTPAEVSEAGPSLARVRRINKYHPSVTVIVPVDDTRRRIWGVDRLLAHHVSDSLLRRTTYNNYNVVFVASDRLGDGELNEIRSRFVQQTSVVRLTGEFQSTQAFNAGLVACTTPYAALLDSYCDIIESDWIETLVAYLSRESVAAVAPVLVDQYGITLSSGLGLTPEPHDIGEGRQPSDLGPVGMFAIARECFGVRSRCAVVDVAALKNVGGFSRDYQTDVVDFDLACKLHEIGLHAIITPLVKVRLFDELHTTHEDSQLFATRWGRYAGNDPYTRFDTRSLTATPA